MNDNYFGMLIKCILASVLLLVGAHVAGGNPWATLAAGCAPLAGYHLLYLTPRARKGITQAAVDSVYYFGFLVTVAALGISAVTIASAQGATDINAVVFQFGVGLFATGYAVLARMHLSSMSTLRDQASPEVILDNYIRRSMELVDNAETAVNRLAEFSTTVVSKTAEVTEATRAQAEKAMLDMARTFEMEMKAALAGASAGITEIRGMVADTSFVTEREELARSIKATVEASTQLNGALKAYSENAQLGASASARSAHTADQLNLALRTLNENVSSLAGEEGAVQQSAKALVEASQVLSGGTGAMTISVAELEGLATSIAEVAPAFVKLRTTSKKAHEQLIALEGITKQLDGALEGIAASSESTAKFSAELNRATQALPELALQSGALAVQLEQTAQASRRVGAELQTLPENSSAIRATSAEVGIALQRIVDSVESAAKQSEHLRANSADAALIVAGAKDLVASADGFEKSLGSLKDTFGGLADTVRTTQTSLVETTASIKTSMAASAEELAASVQRSTSATSLLNDRLIGVAQHIIDRTRERQVALA